MGNIYQLLNEMEDYFEGCKKVPLSSKVMVDIDVVYEFLTDIRLKLPEELKRAERLLKEKENILLEAQKSAENVEKETESRVLKLINEHEITQKAYEQAEELISEAKNTHRELKLGAYEYADEIIETLQEMVKESLIEMHNEYIKLENNMQNQLQVLEGNKNDLKSRKSS